MGDKKLNWFYNNNETISWVASWVTVLGLTAYYFDKDEIIPMFPVVLAGAGTYAASNVLILLLNKDSKIDSLMLEKIKNEILKKPTPSCGFSQKQKIRYNLADYLRLYFSNNPKYLEKRARKTRNPLLAVDSMILYGGKYNNFSQGLTLLRDAYDYLDGKQPELSIISKISQFNQKYAFSLAKYFDKGKTEIYLLYAMYSSITQPEKAYYWSEMARAVAKETNKLLPESFLLHALLATAQKRTDEEQAWEDVLAQCDLNSKREYLGDSQNPVWTINSSELLKSTIVLKADSRENLFMEKKGAQTLNQILESAEPPTPLFISNLPVEGNYIYVMRTAEGDTLYNKLEKKDYSGMTAVEDVLAQIHAKYPLEGLTKLNLEQKIQKKTKDMKLQEDFANSLIVSTEQVRKAITETAYWAAAKDAHPENWILSHTVHPIDTLFKETQPTNLDLANLYNYGTHFTPEEKRQRVKNYDSRFLLWSKKEKKSNQILFREYWNAEIQRAIDLTAAWMTPKRKTRHPHIIPLLERAQLSIQNLKQDDFEYYGKNQEKYTQLNTLLDKLKEHVTPYIS